MNSDRLLEGLKLLVIEDEADIRALLAFVLVEAGAEVTEVMYIYQALETFDRLKPDVILSNVYLPDGDGYEFLKAWRWREAQLGYPLTPAILVTESEREIHEQRLQQAGFQTYIARPFDIEGLVRVVATVAQPG